MNFGVSGEIVFIMLLALILFGPRRMPEIARQVGRFMSDFKNASDALQSQIHEQIGSLELESSELRPYDAATRAEGKDASDGGDEVAPKA
jgi:sec-independent protein translocase protein TatB